jgi:hypothetical protein
VGLARRRNEPDGPWQFRPVWRHEQLLALGFDVVRASLMADDAGVDLAQARKLVALGCPLETASRILL